MRQVLHLELDRSVGQSCQNLIEERRFVSVAKVQLREHRPRCLANDLSQEGRVMGKDEFAVARPAHIEFDHVGDCRGGKEPGECVVWETARPPSVADYQYWFRHTNLFQKTVYSCDSGQYPPCRNPLGLALTSRVPL